LAPPGSASKGLVDFRRDQLGPAVHDFAVKVTDRRGWPA
jgi:hypothetical protein